MKLTYSIVRTLNVMVLMLFSFTAMGQPYSFRKINSGTKSNILSIKTCEQNEVFFMTDKIYKLKNNSWQKLDFTPEGKISKFYALSSQDIWFTVPTLTSTCMLYHYHDGITENIRPPFANYITAIHFTSNNSGLFASISDLAVYENKTFRMLPPSPARGNIGKIYGSDLTSFWTLTTIGELYLYKNGSHKQVLKEKIIRDFCFTDSNNGFLIANGELFKVEDNGIKLILKNANLNKINESTLLENGIIIMVGDNGLIMSYANGHLHILDSQCNENLTDITIADTNSIWISGENGRLLYCGEKKIPAYIKDNQGFSSYKLIYYGIVTDDEYGVALADFNGDEKMDIYTVRIYEQNRMYINNIASANMLSFINGFSEEAIKRNANGVINPEKNKAENELKLGICAADIDNDDDQDIYLCYLNSTNKLLLNFGNGYFRNVSEQKKRACENMKRSNAAAFADIDNDGDLDLFVTNEEGSNRMFENNGTGHFTDITSTSGLASEAGGMCASFSDVNNDGLPDLCVSFWYPSNKLYINDTKNGKIHFREITHLTDLAKAAPSKSNAVTFADVNNDGFSDLFIANRNTGNKLYLNDGRGLFIDKTNEYFQPENFMSNGAVFADFDLDGFQDLYITNVGENVLYKNMNGRYFTDVTSVFGAELSGYCTGCATGDVDNDGDPDLYVANYINGNSKLFLNITEKKSFVKFKLHGVKSNKDAVGAKLWLYKVNKISSKGILAGFRELQAGNSYGSVSAKEMIFGVENDMHYFALIKFPSTPDTIRVDGITAGKILEISELNGFSAMFTENKNKFVRFFTNLENQPEIIKIILIITLLILYNLKMRKNIRNIVIIRWLASCFILILFIFINKVFLFQWLSFSFFIPPVIALGLMVILHLFIDRIFLRRLAHNEKLDLREKLSRDLHDDLASTLGSISIYAETLKSMNEPAQSDFKKLSVKIAGLTQAAMVSISDIIWMTSPRNDSLQSLITKTSNYMLELLTDNNIFFSQIVDIPDDPVILKEKIRNDAFLILKEALHNIIRHSSATKVTFTAELNQNLCTISLKDNGVGIAGSKQLKKGSHGNGLINMRRRAQESKFEFAIISGEGTGTEIVMYFKI